MIQSNVGRFDGDSNSNVSKTKSDDNYNNCVVEMEVRIKLDHGDGY